MKKVIFPALLTLLFLNGCVHPAQYKSVKIGTQEWMPENLNVDRYNDNTAIPEAEDDSTWIAYGKQKKGCWCYFNNDPSNGKKYGKLYNWYALQRLAPIGWHIPSRAEWLVLINFLGGDTVAGNSMKSKTGWESRPGQPSTGDNSSGFTSLPGNSRQVNPLVWGPGNTTTFPPIGYTGIYGSWWTSTEIPGTETAKIYSNDWRDGKVGEDGPDKGNGLSVRCVKD